MSQLARAMTEDEMLTAILEAATYRGWRAYHIRRSDKALAMGHSGFPDVCLARNGKVLFLELKRLGQYARPDQEAWIREINGPEILPSAKVQAYQVNTSQLDVVLSWLE